jgi:hypothetical protein
MTSLKEMAEKLNGLEYGCEPDDKIMIELKNNRMVIVFGASDDLIEMRGASEGEYGAYEGGTICSNKRRKITAVWNPTVKQSPYCFTYDTDISHECFEVLEEGDKYCEGIVFYAMGKEKWEEEE